MEVDELCKRLRPVLGKKIDHLWSLYQAENVEGRKWIQLALLRLLAGHLGQTYDQEQLLLPPPPKSLSAGPYPFGKICYGDETLHEIGLREDEWIQHVGIFGRSGCGKTNLAFVLLLALAKHGKPFLVFDWKRNYRDLIDRLPDTLVFTVGRDISPFYFNPLVPPQGTPPTVWLKKLIEIMAHTYFLGEGVKYVLQNSIDAVYREFRVYDGAITEYPVLEDVLANLERQRVKGRQAEWMSSTLRAIGTLCFGESGKVFNARGSFPLDELLTRNVILELDALTSSDKTFLTEALLLWLHHYRLGQSERETFKHALIIEEAHHILLRRKQEMTGEETITDVILREIRELGEGIILLDQHPSLISKPALGNTYTTVAMNLKHRDDVNAVGNAILLSSKERPRIGELPIGWGVVKLQGRWPTPFVARFPQVQVKKGSVTDGDLAERMDRLLSKHLLMEFERRMLTQRFLRLRGEIQREIEAFNAQEGISERDRVSNEGSQPSPNAEKGDDKEREGVTALLQDIKDRPYDCLRDRYLRLGWSFHSGNKARRMLTERGLIEEKVIKRPDGAVTLLALTAEGKKRIGDEEKQSFRHGGLEHSYWVHHLAKWLKEGGWTVQAEKAIGKGKTVDIAAKREGRRIALEIETGKSNIVANARKCLNAGFDKVLIVTLRSELVQAAQRLLQRAGVEQGARLQVVSLKDLLRRKAGLA